MSGWEILVGVLVMASGFGVLLKAKPMPAGWSSGVLALLGGIYGLLTKPADSGSYRLALVAVVGIAGVSLFRQYREQPTRPVRPLGERRPQH